MSDSKLTEAQMHPYLNRINLPQRTLYPPTTSTPTPTTSPPLSLPLREELLTSSTLRCLQQHHLTTIPFENLSLHYTPRPSPSRAPIEPHQRIPLEKGYVFDKLVLGGRFGYARGGYCMEQNSLFASVLRGLGFGVYSAGARVWKPSRPRSWDRENGEGARAGEEGEEGTVVHEKDERSDDGGVGQEGEMAWQGEWSGFTHQVNIVTLYQPLSPSSPLPSDPEKADSQFPHPYSPHDQPLCPTQGRRYMLDVGFGTHGPTRPICIEDDAIGRVYTQVPGRECRVTREALRRNHGHRLGHERGKGRGGREGEVFVYATRDVLLPDSRAERESGEDEEGRKERNEKEGIEGQEKGSWTPQYCFGDQEFLHADFEVMNHYTSTHPASWFGHVVVCARFLRVVEEGGEWSLRRRQETSGSEAGKGDREVEAVDGKEESEGIVGTVQLTGSTVKRTLNGRTEVVQECRSEGERVGALERWFGVGLRKEEKEGILGRGSCLNG